MQIKQYFLFFGLSILLTGCSWVEYFTVCNLSENPIYVNYKLNKLSEGKSFGIFETSPTFYKATNKGNIDWNHKIEVIDSDKSNEVVSVYLPANTIMVFGRLHNDNYKNYDQNFINSREFNLNYIEFEVNLEIFHISKKYFDDEFKKENGNIKLEIK